MFEFTGHKKIEKTIVALLLGIALIFTAFLGLVAFGALGASNVVAYADGAADNWSSYANTTWYNNTDKVFIINDTLDEDGVTHNSWLPSPR